MAGIPDYMKRVAGWEQTIAAYIANAGDFQEFLPKRVQLEEIATRIKDVMNQRAAYEASKQDATREMEELFKEGETLVHLLRTAVRQFYGPSSDRLIEFGVRPTSSRARRTKPPTPGPEAPAPSVQPVDEQ